MICSTRSTRRRAKRAPEVGDPKLLTLTLYNHERGSVQVSVGRAQKGLAWAIAEITSALQNPKTPEGRALRSCGFCALVFSGIEQDPFVVKFHEGMVLGVADDGKSVQMFPACPEENAKNALQYLEGCLAYAEWVSKTLAAKQANQRPPVVDNSSTYGVADQIRGWIGKEAEQYFHKWVADTRERHALRAAITAQRVS